MQHKTTLSQLTETDYIHIEDYMAFCDYVYDHEAMDKEPGPGVIFVHQDNIQRFFKECRRHKYVIVSGASDFSLFYQCEHHPNTDLRRLSQYCKWMDAAQVCDQYVQIKVGPACDTESCLPEDKYSLKTFCWTKSTFAEIPSNVIRWYCANTNVCDDPRVVWMPYGMMKNAKPPLALRHSPKRKLLYVNFQLYTDERVFLKQYFQSQRWATNIAEPQLPVERYYQDIAEHKFVLCPLGNGLDCYRNYETLYLGSYPLMRRTPFTESFKRAGLPVLLVNDYLQVTPSLLEAKYQEFSKRQFDYTSISLATWRQELSQCKALIK